MSVLFTPADWQQLLGEQCDAQTVHALQFKLTAAVASCVRNGDTPATMAQRLSLHALADLVKSAPLRGLERTTAALLAADVGGGQLQPWIAGAGVLRQTPWCP